MNPKGFNSMAQEGHSGQCALEVVSVEQAFFRRLTQAYLWAADFCDSR
jgi:hypothetical protein